MATRMSKQPKARDTVRAMEAHARVLGIVLAGGEGKRLWPLTADRAKPAVPFGGNYRLVDFVLSNLVNAGYLRLCVLTQYKSHSLDRHITQTWRMSNVLGNYITPVPAQQRLGPRWYTGSADAILQSANLIYDERPDYIIVFDADPDHRIVDFLEKPAEPPGLPGSPNESFASMGNYVFTTEALLNALKDDADDE